MASRSRIFRRMAAALMLSTSLTVAAFALAPSAQAAEGGFAGFSNSGLTYCDAKLYAAQWKVDIDKAKAQIGDKIADGMRDAVDAHIALGRALTSCDWADVPHSYEDAETIAKAWGIATVGEAKDKIAYLYTQGRSADVLAALGGAGDQSGSGDEQAVNVFYESGFTYCDAKLVGAAWGTDTWQGKIAIGNKVMNNMAADVEPILVQGRQVTSCDFTETEVSYEDAETLASIWKVPVDKAKDKVAAYYTAGQSAVVKGALGQTEPASPGKSSDPKKPQNRAD
jgi:hypothetical protein